MNMHVIAGRDFSVDISSDKNHGFLINETAVKTFGLGTPEKAIGKSLDWKIWGKDSIKHATVLGVVKDFNYKSLRESIAPVVIQIAPQYAYELVVRIKPTDIPATIAHLKKTYERLDPDWIFTYNFVDANYDAMYKSEEKLGGLFTVFTVLAIVVACLGLFGLVEYSVNQRSKEISIRKVFGATVRSLLLLLTRRYVGLITIAFILIIPLSYFTATQWLNNFAYHVSIEPQIYLEAGAMVLVVTLATVSFQSLRAALHNPSNNLRNE
jgi:putative ABC transport system permease protein